MRGVLRSMSGALIAMLVLAGCVTTGTQFDIGTIDQLQIGRSMRVDAVALLGPPNMETQMADGGSILAWYGSKVYYGAVGAETQSASLLFDKNGVYQQRVMVQKGGW